jgi:hypothetical protein
MSTSAYIAIWPGRPGGYTPTIADELLQEPGVQSRAKEAQGEAVKHRNRPPKPKASRRSMHGLSAKADKACVDYEARGIAMATQAKTRAKKAGKVAG